MKLADVTAAHQPRQGALDAAHDPVCGMSVDPATARHRAGHAGDSYFFCSAECRERFVADPARYLSEAAAKHEHTAPRAQVDQTLWTCPMHPQIVRDAPGACPICGMALEPLHPGGEAENPELRDMTRRFWAGVVLSAPLLAMAMAEHFAKDALDALIPPRAAVWLQLGACPSNRWRRCG